MTELTKVERVGGQEKLEFHGIIWTNEMRYWKAGKSWILMSESPHMNCATGPYKEGFPSKKLVIGGLPRTASMSIASLFRKIMGHGMHNMPPGAFGATPFNAIAWLYNKDYYFEPDDEPETITIGKYLFLRRTNMMYHWCDVNWTYTWMMHVWDDHPDVIPVFVIRRPEDHCNSFKRWHDMVLRSWMERAIEDLGPAKLENLPQKYLRIDFSIDDFVQIYIDTHRHVIDLIKTSRRKPILIEFEKYISGEYNEDIVEMFNGLVDIKEIEDHLEKKINILATDISRGDVIKGSIMEKEFIYENENIKPELLEEAEKVRTNFIELCREGKNDS